MNAGENPSTSAARAGSNPRKPTSQAPDLRHSTILGGVGRSTNTSSTPTRAANARATSAHTPFSSPVAGSLVYCGGNSAILTLPTRTRSATRGSGACWAPAIQTLASNAAIKSGSVRGPEVPTWPSALRGRAPPGHAQRLPGLPLEVLREIDDLAHVLAVVHELAVDRIEGAEALAPD